MLIDILFLGMIPLAGSVAGLGSPGPSGIILICNKAWCISELVSQYFLIVCFTSLMQAATWPLLW